MSSGSEETHASGGTGGAPAGAAFPEGYERLELIGTGGTGHVYRARDRALNRFVAVKVLRDDLETNGPAAIRFRAEAGVTARLAHPGVPPVHAVGAFPDGRPYIVLKLIEGRTLKELLAGGLDRSRFLYVFESVVQTVAFAHGRGVIHRDLKPGNIMVGPFDDVQVMDWGLAREVGAAEDALAPTPSTGGSETTIAGLAKGTPQYIPPEQARGDWADVDRRADVFALGGILCAALTGAPPFALAQPLETAQKGDLSDAHNRLRECAKPREGGAPRADPELVDLAIRCLAPKPAGRPADAAAVLAELRGWRAAGERARHERAVAEDARDRARGLYQTALGAFNGTVIGVLQRLEARGGADELQRELLTAARSGLSAILGAAEPEPEPGTVRLSDAVAPEADASVAGELERFADQLARLGRADDARAAFARAIGLRRAAGGPALVPALRRWATFELGAGDFAAARALALEALQSARAGAGEPALAGETDLLEALVELCAEG